MKKRISLLIFISFILLISISSLQAADNLNSTNDVDQTTVVKKDTVLNDKLINDTKADNTKTSTNVVKNVSTYSQLATEINNAKVSNDSSYTINLKKGTYTANQVIELGWGRGKLRNVTINGQGSTIDGNSKSAFFKVCPWYTLTINNLTIKNTKTSAHAEGAIFATNVSTLNINSCTFMNNIATERGGAISSRGDLNIKNSVFITNTARFGSAIWHTGEFNGAITITGSTFKKHTVPNSYNSYSNDKTGMIYIIGKATANINNNMFEENNGRVIHLFGLKDAQVSNNRFVNNKISVSGSNQVIRGGIIDIYEASATLTDNQFYASNTQTATSNTGVSGGVLYHEIGQLVAKNNLFANTASGTSVKDNGGSIFLRNLTATLAANNFTNTYSGVHLRGGSVYINMARVTLEQNIFNNVLRGSGTLGGAVYNDPTGKLSVWGNSFNSKVSGGNNQQNGIASLGSMNTLSKTISKLTVDNIAAKFGDTITLKANVLTASNAKINGGQVSFKINNQLINKATVYNGVASVKYALPSTFTDSKYTVSADYSGTSSYGVSANSASLTLSKKNVDVALFTGVKKIVLNKTLNLTASVKNGNKKVNEGFITFKINGKDLTKNGKVVKVQVTNGIAKATYKLPTTFGYKTNNITAVYSGTSLYKDAKSTTKKVTTYKLNVKTALYLNKSKVKAKDKITIKTVVKQGDKSVTKGYVTFKLDNKVIKKVNVKNGVAKFEYKVPSSLAVGKHNIVSQYFGNYLYNDSKILNKTLQINK